MKRIGSVVICVVLAIGQLSLLAVNKVVATPETMAPPVITEIQVSGKCVLVPSTDCHSTNSAEFVEIYNPNEVDLPLAGYELKFQNQSGSTTWSVALDAAVVLQPKQFALVTRDYMPPDTSIVGTVTGTKSLVDSAGSLFLVNKSNIQSPVIVDEVAWGSGMTAGFYGTATNAPTTGKSSERCFINGQLQEFNPRDTSKEFTIYDSPSPGEGTDCIVPSPPASVVNCTGIAINEIGANIDDQFIELYNTTPFAVPLAGCRLQTNRSSQASYIFTQAELGAGEYVSVPIASTSLTLTKTTSGEVYLLSSDGQVETDVRSYSDLDEGTSWSYFTDGWRQTYATTPGASNIDLPYLPCETGYYRNLTTGRCNIIPLDDPAIPCNPGQYRSDETGRCRNLATTVDTRKPCRDDQYRSEETGRCRNITLASSTRKPCKDNQYRSEETGRCRNLPAGTVPNAAFAVQPVKDTGMAFVGWWALGGVVLLAVSYGVWEWRREIAAFWQRFFNR